MLKWILSIIKKQAITLPRNMRSSLKEPELASSLSLSPIKRLFSTDLFSKKTFEASQNKRTWSNRTTSMGMERAKTLRVYKS